MQIYLRLFKLLSTGSAEPILVRQRQRSECCGVSKYYNNLYCKSGVSLKLDARTRIGFALPV